MEKVNWMEIRMSKTDPILQFRLLGWAAEGKVNQAGRRLIVSSLCPCILVS